MENNDYNIIMLTLVANQRQAKLKGKYSQKYPSKESSKYDLELHNKWQRGWNSTVLEKGPFGFLV